MIRLRAALLCVALLAPAAPALAGSPPPEIAASDLKDGPEGLRFVDLERGEGEPAQANDRLPVSIRMWTDPTGNPVVIGSAAEPLEATVAGGSLIRGLDIGLVGMRPGGTRYLDIPVSLTSGAGTPMTAVIHVYSEAELDDPSSVASDDEQDPDEDGEDVADDGGRAPTGNRLSSGSLGGGAAPLPVRTPPESPPSVGEDEWTVRKNGLHIYDAKAGTGAELDKGMTVTVEYTGWVAETGERFDSSLARAEPFRFTLGGGQVILGWDKGLRGMQVGGTRVLRIPAYLAYGAAGAGSIPPHADLVFQVQVLDAR